MSEQLYRVCWRYEGRDETYSGRAVSKDAADWVCTRDNIDWAGMIVFWVEPVPPYTRPAITAEMDLETRAGSPRGIENDLLGLP